MDGVDEAAHRGMGMDNIQGAPWSWDVARDGGDSREITTLEKPEGAGDGNWVHQGAANGAAGPQLRALVPLSCPWWSFQLDNESSITDTIFQFSTEELWLLPLRDLAVFHNGDASHQFGFTVGPVCFS